MAIVAAGNNSCDVGKPAIIATTCAATYRVNCCSACELYVAGGTTFTTVACIVIFHSLLFIKSTNGCTRYDYRSAVSNRTFLTAMAAHPAKKKRAWQKFKLEYMRTWPVLIESVKKGMYFALCNLFDIDFSISRGGRDDCRPV